MYKMNLMINSVTYIAIHLHVVYLQNGIRPHFTLIINDFRIMKFTSLKKKYIRYAYFQSFN